MQERARVLIRQALRTLARRSLLGLASKFGYEIRKAPFVGFKSAPIFDLTVQYLMLKHGESLRFIQVGANDGKFGDPLREYILKHKWKGVLVEPQPELYEALKLNYAGFEDRLFFENVAITNLSSRVSLYRARNISQRVDGLAIATSSVASIDPMVTSRQLKLKPVDLERILVPTTRLDDLVAKYALTNFEILQIDTEGHEWHVLQTLDLSKTKPALIQFECGHLSPKDIGTVTQHLNSNDYFVYFGGNQGDSLAMHRTLLEPLASQTRSPRTNAPKESTQQPPDLER